MNIQSIANSLHPVQNRENLDALTELTKSSWDRFQETEIPWVLKLKPDNAHTLPTLGPIWSLFCLGLVSCFLILTGDLAFAGSFLNSMMNPLHTISGAALLAAYGSYDSHYLLNLAEGKLFTVKGWGHLKTTQEVLNLSEPYSVS